jgi:hypothetical protein
MTASTKTLMASVGVLALTVLHHFYGATIYDAPFRQHVALGILPVLFVLILAYWVYRFGFQTQSCSTQSTTQTRRLVS